MAKTVIIVLSKSFDYCFLKSFNIDLLIYNKGVVCGVITFLTAVAALGIALLALGMESSELNDLAGVAGLTTRSKS